MTYDEGFAAGMRRAAEITLLHMKDFCDSEDIVTSETNRTLKDVSAAILAAISASAPWTPPDGFCECLGWVRGEWLHVVRMGRDKPWQWVSEEGDTVSPTAFAPLPPAPEAQP